MAARMTAFYVSTRHVRLLRSYHSVHRDPDCAQLSKGAREVAQLPDEFARFLPPCSYCIGPEWSMESPAPRGLFAWYREVHA